MSAHNDTLCADLYEDGFSFSPPALDFSVMTPSAAVPHEGNSIDIEGMDSQCLIVAGATQSDILRVARRNIERSLFCLQDWARWKDRGCSDDEARPAVESRYENGYIGWTSDGWAYVNDDISEDSDRESAEVEVDWLGYLFFGRTLFASALQDAPPSSDEVVAKLIQLASQVPIVAEHGAYGKSDFERLYLSGSPEAGEWQGRVPDSEEDHDSLLLSLLRAM